MQVCTSAADAGRVGAADVNGNQVLKSQNGVNSTFIYDVRDQLISVRQGATVLGDYGYDYQGLRTSKTDATSTRRYTYDEQSVLLQSDSNGQTLATYRYGPDQLLSLDHSTEGQQYYLFDGLGSVVNLTKPDGSLQARYQYDAWGNTRAQTGTSANPFGFTGHEKDEESGLYYFKARFYDASLGRFLSQDSYLGATDTPPSLHRYLYAYANPTVYTDPTGNYPETEALADYLSEKADDARVASDHLSDGAGTSALGFMAGIGAGIMDLASLGVEGVNQGLNVAVDTLYDENSTNKRVTDSRRDLKETRGEFTNTIENVANGVQMAVEDPKGTGTKLLNATKQFGSDLARGDAGAFANLGTAVGVPLPAAAAAKIAQGTSKAAKLDKLYGRAEEPGGVRIKPHEQKNGEVIKNVGIRKPTESNPLKVSTVIGKTTTSLGKKKPGYIWSIDENGQLIVGLEKRAGQEPDGYVLRQGHPTLTNGGKARISGELKYINDKWVINKSSGRYTKPYYDRNKTQLENAKILFGEHGLEVDTHFREYK